MARIVVEGVVLFVALVATERLSGYGMIVKQFTMKERRAPPPVIEAINQKK